MTNFEIAFHPKFAKDDVIFNGARFGCRLSKMCLEKQGAYTDISDAFREMHFTQDAPNMAVLNLNVQDLWLD